MTELASMSLEKQLVATVSGRRLLAALGVGFAAGALVGTTTYYAIHFALPTANSSTLAQVIVVEVYALLTAALAVAFRPIHDLPLCLHFTSFQDLAPALVAWLGIVAASAVAYFLLKPAFGSLTHALRQILIDATDAKRLQGQPAAAWAIAVARGCLLVPLFEELFFRGALLQWLRRYFSPPLAIVVSAVLFAALHIYPIAMPYAFVFGVFTGWIRIRTGSTLNSVFMHVLNNFVFLYLGLLLLR